MRLLALSLLTLASTPALAGEGPVVSNPTPYDCPGPEFDGQCIGNDLARRIVQDEGHTLLERLECATADGTLIEGCMRVLIERSNGKRNLFTLEDRTCTGDTNYTWRKGYGVCYGGYTATAKVVLRADVQVGIGEYTFTTKNTYASPSWNGWAVDGSWSSYTLRDGFLLSGGRYEEHSIVGKSHGEVVYADSWTAYGIASSTPSQPSVVELCTALRSLFVTDGIEYAETQFDLCPGTPGSLSHILLGILTNCSTEAELHDYTSTAAADALYLDCLLEPEAYFPNEFDSGDAVPNPPATPTDTEDWVDSGPQTDGICVTGTYSVEKEFDAEDANGTVWHCRGVFEVSCGTDSYGNCYCTEAVDWDTAVCSDT